MKRVYKDGKYTGVDIHDESEDNVDVEDFGFKILGFIALPFVILTFYYIIKLWYCVLISAILWGLICLFLYLYWKNKKTSDESVWKYGIVFLSHGISTALTFYCAVFYKGYNNLFPLIYKMFSNAGDNINTIALFILVISLTLIYSGISSSIYKNINL